MIDKIKEMFGDRIVEEFSDVESVNNYRWYKTPQDQPFGIRKHSLTEYEVNLLEIFVTPLPAYYLQLSTEQTMWKQLLFEGTQPDSKSPLKPSRILQFRILSKDADQELFQEAIENMLSDDLIFVWKNTYSLIVIEPFKDEPISAQQFQGLMQTIESDFFIKAVVFIGTAFHTFQDSVESFEKEARIFQSFLSLKNINQVYTLASSFPNYLLSQMDDDDYNFIRNHIFHTIEPELKDTVKMLLKCNLNYSLAAKNLFIHRNSLQYRMDKFTEQTGLDVKTIPDAVTAYLLLLKN
ncbi:PucR family transcriptional regulator [Pseudalkalibacillus decolorationis]|uniref:PucR family transcriptional regulator n=1 Tax=Pseudalkalibacillus decolorationis TaxID=163879 RepID=UPI002148F67E|nr:helix-turn-helix domain-containing protein [Pseudalkalibacillus decolorationis]